MRERRHVVTHVNERATLVRPDAARDQGQEDVAGALCIALVRTANRSSEAVVRGPAQDGVRTMRTSSGSSSQLAMCATIFVSETILEKTRAVDRMSMCVCVRVGRDLFGRAFEDAKHVRDRHPVRIGREGLQRRDREPDVGLIRWGLGAETATCGSRRQWDHSHPSRAVLLQGIPQGAPAGRSARWP